MAYTWAQPPKSLATAFLVLSLVLYTACGAAASPTPPPANPTHAGAAHPTAALVPTATPRPTPTTAAVSSRDSITLVVGEDPVSLSAFSAKCTASPEVYPCGDYSADTLTYISEKTRQVIPLSGTEKWVQIAPDRWRFTLRQGVKFHNGELFDAAAAKFSIDILGELKSAHLSVSYTGPVLAAVVDPYTVEVVCGGPCPIYPKNAILTRFQAPAWYKAASEAERDGTTVGFGPYRLTEWRRGEFVKMEAYEGYLARADVAEAQAPHIKRMTQVTRKEATVRAAMVKTGEADWAFEIGDAGAKVVPEARFGGAAEMIVLKLDTIWHPLLKKKEFRLALAHAMDCPEIVAALYGNRTSCSGNAAPAGTLGLTPENSRPYAYDRAKAKELLKQAGYAGEEIRLGYRVGRFYRDSELIEAIAGAWREAGINVKIQGMESAIHRDFSITGCGQYADNPLDCMNRPPPPPSNASPQVITYTPSVETLDFGKVALQALSCYSTRSDVCDANRLEPIITRAVAATGDERKLLLEQVATILHDDALIIGVFEGFVVYGVNKDLVWEPRYDRRVRLNMMSFKK